MRKFLIIGMGSIGQRHAANLRGIWPNAHLVLADPAIRVRPEDQWIIDWTDSAGNIFTDYRVALAAHPDATAAIIASPTAAHGEQMWALAEAGVSFYVEKPLGTVNPPIGIGRCATGFQYRFHPAMTKVARINTQRHLMFTAYDDLLGRYGPHVAAVMASHPIDTAIRLLGPVEKVGLASNGVWLSGFIDHAHGSSYYDIDMGSGPRVSRVDNGNDFVDLPPSDAMYRDALSAWLGWVESGVYPPPLATLADGLAVEQVLAEVRYA